MRCDCGQQRLCLLANLTNGSTKSCGCLNRESLSQAPRRLTHGLAGTREYAAWLNMIQRCHGPNAATRWPHWAGRGIVVCDEWRDDVAAFLAHVGPKPGPDYSLDRIDNDGNYTVGNVRWATRSEQNRNQRPRRRAA